MENLVDRINERLNGELKGKWIFHPNSEQVDVRINEVNYIGGDVEAQVTVYDKGNNEEDRLISLEEVKFYCDSRRELNGVRGQLEYSRAAKEAHEALARRNKESS
jgi:hypothetical protein